MVVVDVENLCGVGGAQCNAVNALVAGMCRMKLRTGTINMTVFLVEEVALLVSEKEIVRVCFIFIIC